MSAVGHVLGASRAMRARIGGLVELVHVLQFLLRGTCRWPAEKLASGGKGCHN